MFARSLLIFASTLIAFSACTSKQDSGKRTEDEKVSPEIPQNQNIIIDADLNFIQVGNLITEQHRNKILGPEIKNYKNISFQYKFNSIDNRLFKIMYLSSMKSYSGSSGVNVDYKIYLKSSDQKTFQQIGLNLIELNPNTNYILKVDYDGSAASHLEIEYNEVIVWAGRELQAGMDLSLATRCENQELVYLDFIWGVAPILAYADEVEFLSFNSFCGVQPEPPYTKQCKSQFDKGNMKSISCSAESTEKDSYSFEIVFSDEYDQGHGPYPPKPSVITCYRNQVLEKNVRLDKCLPILALFKT